MMQEEAEFQTKIEEQERSKKQLVSSSDDPFNKLERAFVDNMLGVPDLEAMLAMVYKKQG